MYQIRKDAEMTLTELASIISHFQTWDLPKLNKAYQYYEGKQAILQKVATDDGKPANKIIVNYCRDIVNNYNGYITGKAITYSGDDIDAIIDVLNYNDSKNEDSEFLKSALICGRAYEINYIDSDGQQRFKVLDPRTCIPIYDDTLNQDLKYVIRFWEEPLVDSVQPKYIVEVYSANNIQRYRSLSGFSTFEPIETLPNYFNQVPITVLQLPDDQAVFEPIKTLQDAYNTLLSAEVDDFEAFADAYMLLKGMVADEEDLADMKKHRVLLMDNDSDASYLTKNISDTQIQNMLDNINQQIYRKVQCPDFSDEKFMAQSGEAIKYKLVGFECQAATIESYMRKALQKRIELICSVLSKTGDMQVWRDIDIIFTRNLPTSMVEITTTVNALRGLVSDETLLAQIPFVEDIDEELARVKKQRDEQMKLYSFDTIDEGLNNE